MNTLEVLGVILIGFIHILFVALVWYKQHEANNEVFSIDSEVGTFFTGLICITIILFPYVWLLGAIIRQVIVHKWK